MYISDVTSAKNKFNGCYLYILYMYLIKIHFNKGYSTILMKH